MPFIPGIMENIPEKIESTLTGSYMEFIKIHNRQQDLPVIHNKAGDFYGRPYSVIMAEDMAELLLDSIEEAELKKKCLTGGALDIKSDSDDFTDSGILSKII